MNQLIVPLAAGQLYVKLPNDCALLVGAVVEVVIPVTIKLELAPHVAKGTGGAPVVAPLELTIAPF